MSRDLIHRPAETQQIGTAAESFSDAVAAAC